MRIPGTAAVAVLFFFIPFFMWPDPNGSVLDRYSVIPDTESTNTEHPEKNTVQEEKTVQKSEKDISMARGIAALYVPAKTGSFGIFSRNPDNAALFPLIAGYDNFSSTFFELQADSVTYRLNRVCGIPSRAERTRDGITITYTIDKKASVQVAMTFAASSPQRSPDALRMAITTTNTGKQARTFSLRAVFDTILGEESFTHFSTAAKDQINAECLFETMKNDRWILSKNAENSIQFLVYGPGITSPNRVYLGNKDVIAASWIPGIKKDRSFNSVFSYNNSAIGINWNSSVLQPEASGTVTFYIVVSSEGRTPAGSDLLATLSGQQTVPASAGPAEAEKAAPAVLPAPVEPRPEVEFTVESIKDEQLDPAYIQRLIDKINSLESNDTTIDRQELLRLNAELDAILQKLRQK
jgi:hypothetical protein